MPCRRCTGGGDLAAGVQAYTVNNSLSQDAVFVVVDKRADREPVCGQGRAEPDGQEVRPDSRTPSAPTPASGLLERRSSLHRASTRLATLGYETTPDVQIDGKITLRKNGGTTKNTLVTLHAARRPRFHGITIEQTTTSVPYLIGCVLFGCVEAQFNGCKVTTTSPQGSNGSLHPYALKFAACANYDVFNHVGHSNGWHAVDNEADNLDDTWGMHTAVPSAHFGGQFGDIRNGRMSARNNNFPCICHTSNHIRCSIFGSRQVEALRSMAMRHNIECIEALPGGDKTQISHTRGVGGTRIWHCNFNNPIGNWGNGAYGITKCRLRRPAL